MVKNQRNSSKGDYYIDWIDYWNKKGASGEKDIKKISGYEGHLSYLPNASKKLLIASIVSKLKLNKNDKLLDVGCGVGILTVEFKKYAGEVVGIDASRFMLKLVPSNIKTYLAEVSNMPFPDQEFDKILCHSIFQYFPNLDYAQKVVKEMYRVCKIGGLIYIIDVPDEAKKILYSKNKKIEKHNLTRLFYQKSFFKRIYSSARVFNNKFPGYGNARYRFNILITKK